MTLGFLVGTLFSLIVFTILLSVSNGIPFIQVAQATGSIAIGISAVVGINLYIATTNRHRAEDKRKTSEEYLKEAIKILERAYEIFTDDGTNVCPPRNDRLLWLTTARMILRYYKIKAQINQTDLSEIVQEHEEYWRVQLYNVLNQNTSNFTVGYFQPSGNRYGGDTVHRDSIGVIFDFAKWYDDSEDPLNSADVISMYAKGALPLDQHGARSFIEQYEEYFSKIVQRKSELESDT